MVRSAAVSSLAVVRAESNNPADSAAGAAAPPNIPPPAAVESNNPPPDTAAAPPNIPHAADPNICPAVDPNICPAADPNFIPTDVGAAAPQSPPPLPLLLLRSIRRTERSVRVSRLICVAALPKLANLIWYLNVPMVNGSEAFPSPKEFRNFANPRSMMATFSVEYGCHTFFELSHSQTATVVGTGAGVVDFAEKFGYAPIAAIIKAGGAFGLNPAAAAAQYDKIARENNVDLSEVYDLAKTIGSIKTKYYNENGKQQDGRELLAVGEFLKGAEILLNDAVGSAPSLALSLAFPIAGSALLGMATAGQGFEEDLINRPKENLANSLSNSRPS